jgi:hypothetical protein
MLRSLKRQWRAFHKGKPGHRFQERYDRNEQSRESQSWVQRLIQPLIAIVSLAIGVVLTFIPGPAILFYFIGAGLLAGESRTLARWLDWSELKSRKAFHRAKRWWKHAGLFARSGVILSGVCVTGGAVYLAYCIFLVK